MHEDPAAANALVDLGRCIEELEDSGRHMADRTLRESATMLDAARAAGDDLLVQRLQLVQADVATRSGRIEEGVRLIREVEAWAEAHDEAFLLTRSHRLMSAVFAKLGDTALCLEHAVSAVHGLQRDWRPSLRADHLRALGQALSYVGSYDEARTRFEDALQLTEAAGSAVMRRMALNDLAYCEVLAKRGPEAASAADRLLAFIAAAGVRPGYEEIDTVAAAYELSGRLAEAELMLAPVVDGVGADSSFSDYDGAAGCLWRLARVQRQRGRLADARRTLDECRDRMVDLSSVVALERDREEVELLAALGDFEAAYHAQKHYYEARDALEDAQRVSRATTLKAIFDAEEARRESVMFRDLAERDALTGLRNRRFVDDHLPRVLLDAVEQGSTLTVGLLDLDHFKRVNDTLSHAVGDDVLRRVATILDETAGQVDGGVAARLGGEEFLVVLPGITGASGVDLLERLRRIIAGTDWSGLTGSLPVTVSVGVASAPSDQQDASALLHEADQRLYAAKAAGRDRVVGAGALGAVGIAG